LILAAVLLGGKTSQAVSFTPFIDLTVLGDLYVTEGAKDFSNGQLHGRFKGLHQEEALKIYLDLGAGGLAGKQAESYFILPQAFISYDFSDSVNVTIGRVVKSFSVIDEYWLLGDVMPLFRWDAARPEMQGIPGVLVEYAPNRNLQVDLLMSYLYLPTQGPSYSIIDGKLESGNPWFSDVVDVLEVSGVPYDLRYSINTPEISDVILQPSFGAVVTLKSDSEVLWARGGYFMKSRNDLVLPFEGVIDLSAKNGDIVVHPQVAEHKIALFDTGLKFEDWAITYSSIYESDVTFPVEANNWIYPAYTDQYKLGLNVSWQATAFHTIEMGGLKTFNNNVSVLGLAGAGTLDIYSYRNQYDNAVDLRLTSVFVPRQHGFLFKTKIRCAYDYEVETSLLSFDFTYRPVAEVSIFTRMDLFGGERIADAKYNNFLVNYLSRDRAQLGVQYVF